MQRKRIVFCCFFMAGTTGRDRIVRRAGYQARMSGFLISRTGITGVTIRTTQVVQMRIFVNGFLGYHIAHKIIRPNRGRGACSPFTFGATNYGGRHEFLHNCLV